VDTFGESDDTWKAYSVRFYFNLLLKTLFQCYEYQWPSVEEAKKFDALFITGSRCCLRDGTVQTWIEELIHMMALYVRENVRIVGICFGCHVPPNQKIGKWF